MKAIDRHAILIWVALSLALGTALSIWWRFHDDMRKARDRVAQGSVLIETRCGPIEYQEAGAGLPLLAVHGSGGGHDQGMAFAGSLASRGIRVIAMSRFGYGTFASAAYTAQRIPDATFIGFDQGGHTWVGHDDQVLAAIAGLLLPAARP